MICSFSVLSFIDIISTATIIFGEPEINKIIEVGHIQLIQDNLMLRNSHFSHFEMNNTMNSDKNTDNEVLEIPLNLM